MTLDDKITRAKRLIAQRDEIDAELTAMFGHESRRGRPRKQNGLDATDDPAGSEPQAIS